MYGQLTTGAFNKDHVANFSKRPAHYFEIHIDTAKNVPTILKDETVDWKKAQGTRVEIELEAKYQKGRHSVEDYVRQTIIANLIDAHLH